MSALDTVLHARHSFVVGVTGFPIDQGAYEDAPYDAGCGDALIRVVGDRLELDFDRDAPCYETAVQSALRDIQRAGRTIARVTPDA